MKKRIMIIDDETEILEMLERFLKRSEKFDIDTFYEPKKGLSHLKTHGHYDLVLLDIMMPELSGIDILTDIKESNTNIKTIIMTAYSTMDKVINCKHLGADDYVTKPFVSLRDIENKVLDNLGL